MTDERRRNEIADLYALGLLEGEEREAVERQLETDPELVRAVSAMRDLLLELDMTANPVPTSAGTWERIEAAIDRLPDEAPADDRAAVTPPSAPPGAPVTARPPAGTAPPPAVADNDNRYVGWRAASLIATAAAFVLAVALGYTATFGPTAKVVAVLLDSQGSPLALVEDYGNDSAVVTPLTTFDIPPGRTMQVWTKPSEDIGPVSLGLLPASARTFLSGPDLPPPSADQLYEITVEQDGGSPTGLPTGPVLVKGFGRLPR